MYNKHNEKNIKFYKLGDENFIFTKKLINNKK